MITLTKVEYSNSYDNTGQSLKIISQDDIRVNTDHIVTIQKFYLLDTPDTSKKEIGSLITLVDGRAINVRELMEDIII